MSKRERALVRLQEEKSQKQKAKPLPINRCGECTACCHIMGVKELGKPYYSKCEHLCGTGCGIYGKHPDSCRNFGCTWRMGWFDLDRSAMENKVTESNYDMMWWQKFLPNNIDFRPDNLGVMFTIDDVEEGVCGYKVRPDVDMKKVKEASDVLRTLFPEMVPPIVKIYEYNAEIEIPYTLSPKYL